MAGSSVGSFGLLSQWDNKSKICFLVVASARDSNCWLGWAQQKLNAHTTTLFLRAASDNRRNSLRSDLTRKKFMLEGLNTDFVDARGKFTVGSYMDVDFVWRLHGLLFICGHGVDPTPVEALLRFKEEMAKK